MHGNDDVIDLSCRTRSTVLIDQRERDRTRGISSSSSSGFGSTSPISIISSSSSDCCVSPPPLLLGLIDEHDAQHDDAPPPAPANMPAAPVRIVYKRLPAPDYIHDMQCIRKSIRPNFYTLENTAPPPRPRSKSASCLPTGNELDAAAALLQLACTPIADQQLPEPLAQMPLDDPQRAARYHGRGFRFVVDEVDASDFGPVIGVNRTRVAWRVLDAIDFRDHCGATWLLMDALFTREQQQCRWHVELAGDRNRFDPAQVYDVMEFVSHVSRVHVEYVCAAIARKCDHELALMGGATTATRMPEQPSMC